LRARFVCRFNSFIHTVALNENAIGKPEVQRHEQQRVQPAQLSL